MTDKYTNGFDKVYRDMFSRFIGKPINFLEIGIAGGESLLMFEEMLPEAKIYGFDILPEPQVLTDSSIITRVIDQNDSQAIMDFADNIGCFDIIIDDGSHFTKETENCFAILWDYVKDGGYYIIEDWGITYATHLGYYRVHEDKVKGMADLVYRIAHAKSELGIDTMEIVYKKNCTYAAFSKAV